MKIVKYKALIPRPSFIIAHPPGHPSSIAFSLAFTSLYRTPRHPIEIKSTFHTRRSQESEMWRSEITQNHDAILVIS